MTTRTDIVLRQYDEKIYSLVDDSMDWTVKYRTDAEVDKRDEIIVARYGINVKEDSRGLTQDRMNLQYSSVYSNMIMSYLLSKKIKVRDIDLRAYYTKCFHTLSLAKREAGGSNAPLPAAQVERQVQLLKLYTKLFLSESLLMDYLLTSGSPSPKLTGCWDLGVVHVRRALMVCVHLLYQKQYMGHELVVMWEIKRISDTSNFEIVLYVIDNLPSSSYTADDLNIDLHQTMIDCMLEEITLRAFASRPAVSVRAIRTTLPGESYAPPGGSEVSYSCMSISRRAVLYSAMLPNLNLLGVMDALESFVPMEQIMNIKKRKKMSPTETRYAYHLMMYVRCLYSIFNYILQCPLIWTSRDLLSLNAEEVAREKPFPIYLVSFVFYNGLPLDEFMSQYRTWPGNNGKFFLDFAQCDSFILYNADTHQEKKLTFDMENPKVMIERSLEYDSSAGDYCTIMSRCDLLGRLRDMHVRLLSLEN